MKTHPFISILSGILTLAISPLMAYLTWVVVELIWGDFPVWVDLFAFGLYFGIGIGVVGMRIVSSIHEWTKETK